MILTIAAFHFPTVHRLVNSTPALFIKNGKRNERNMAAERVRHPELDAMLRECGIAEPNDVKQALLEPSGMLTVEREPEARPATKRDLMR
jgi:uncharacterized membrane protein YcaP (DUF421 family)